MHKAISRLMLQDLFTAGDNKKGKRGTLVN